MNCTNSLKKLVFSVLYSRNQIKGCLLGIYFRNQKFPEKKKGWKEEGKETIKLNVAHTGLFEKNTVDIIIIL